jgi:ATP/maltotriose-dependent transcriptional regulator MalT
MEPPVELLRYSKLGVSNRTTAVASARELALLD